MGQCMHAQRSLPVISERGGCVVLQEETGCHYTQRLPVMTGNESGIDIVHNFCCCNHKTIQAFQCQTHWKTQNHSYSFLLMCKLLCCEFKYSLFIMKHMMFPYFYSCFSAILPCTTLMMTVYMLIPSFIPVLCGMHAQVDSIALALGFPASNPDSSLLIRE